VGKELRIRERERPLVEEAARRRALERARARWEIIL